MGLRVLSAALPCLGATVLLSTSLASCSDSPRSPLEPAPAAIGSIVTEPLAAQSVHAVPGEAPAILVEVVYVSLREGSYPDAVYALVRHDPSGTEVRRPVINGAVDPVALPAVVGDSIKVSVMTHEGVLVQLMAPVPPKSRPHVVRTVPPRGKTDVPFNNLMTVVFSKPMAPNTIGGIRLLRANVPIAGNVFLSADGLYAELQPARPLEANQAYVLSVPATLSDVAGNTMDEEVEVQFTTAADGAPPDLVSAIAYAARGSGEGMDIHVIDAERQGVARLTTDPADDLEPAWSPDGSHIAFTRTGEGSSGIFVTGADGSAERRLTNHPAPVYEPAWSPDGSKIAFVSERDGNPEIYVMNAQGGEETRLTNAASAERSPSWSPDGTRIAFSSDRDGNGEIYVMNADGSTVQRLTEDEQDDADPAFSPDGTRIAFSRLSAVREGGLPCTPIEQIDMGNDVEGYERMCRRDILIMAAHGMGAPVRLAFPYAHAPRTESSWWRSVFIARHPTWSPDGQRIASEVFVCFSDFGGADCHPTTTIVLAAASGAAGFVELSGGALVAYDPREQFGPAWRP